MVLHERRHQALSGGRAGWGGASGAILTVANARRSESDVWGASQAWSQAPDPAARVHPASCS